MSPTSGRESSMAPWPDLAGAGVVSPALFAHMLGASPDCEAWLDAQGHLAWINGAALRVTGRTPAQCMDLADFPAPLVLPSDQHIFEALRSDARVQPAQGQLRLLLPDGSINWVTVSWQPLSSHEGRALGTRVSLRDSAFSDQLTSSQRDHLIAFRREAARITREAKTRGPDFKSMCDYITAQAAEALKVARVGIWLFEAQGTELSCVSLYLAANSEHTDGGSIPVAAFPTYMAAISTDELIVAPDACQHELTAELAEGYLKPLHITSMLDAPIQQGGKTVGVLCTEHGPDMRHWAAAEIAFADALAEFIGLHLEALEREALQTTSRRLASIIEATTDTVFIIKLDGDISYVNQAGRALIGVASDDPLTGINAMEFVPPELRDRRRSEIIPQALRTGHWSGEVSALTRSGECIPIWEDLIAHREADGRVRYLSAVVRDLRGQKQTENELRRREQALSKLNNELEQRVQERTRKIEEVNKNLETFAFSVSHDLKAPLRGIDGYSRLLMEDYAERLPDEAKSFIHNIRQAAQSMSQLIDDLLAYSRVGRRELSVTRFSIRSAVQRVLTERGHDIEQHGVTILDDIQALELKVDLDCFLQIIRNLIDNAVKFSRQSAHPTITLRTEQSAQHVVFSVKDNGCGFDMKYHDRIFSIFQRLHRAEDYPGTGVGLAIVSKAAERLGGRVWARSTPGQGAEFFLELPVQP